ncbi:MAG: Gmad2 immunoglobulin-like domain-containing protein [Ornithinimicrobium sp.]
MSLSVQQPQPYDLISDVILIAGIAGGAFEANYEFEITEGHDSVSGHFMAGDGIGGHAQFQLEVDVSAARFTLSRVFVHVFHQPPTDDGGRADEVVIPVVLGSQILPGFIGYGEYVVQPGDTLWSIAADRLGSGSNFPLLVAANVHTIPDPDVISVGQVIRIPMTS